MSFNYENKVYSMERFVTVEEKLKYVYTLANCDPLEMPSIIIIGDQNSGKSTLLERLVEQEFLPIRSNILTKCPLEVELVKKERKDTPDYAVFLNTPDSLITDFELVRQQIEIVLEKKTNKNNISSEAILLRIYRNKVINLRLIDLPGLKKMSIGAQTQEVELLRNIAMKYICEVNSIIVIVIAANTEIISNEALKLVKEVDPKGNRTVVALSKLDLVDHCNKTINEILNGKHKVLNMNIIGIMNPSSSNTNTVESKQVENTFLKQNFALIAHRHGIEGLNNSLNLLLFKFLSEYITKLRHDINQSLLRDTETIAKYKEPINDYYRLMLELVSSFTLAYTSIISGSSKELETTELTGGARINYIFREIFGQTIKSINPLDGFTRATLLTAIRNASGIKSTIFIPDKCFELLIKTQIKKLEVPSLRCVQLVYDEMEKLIYNCGQNPQLCRFPKLQQRIITVVLEFLKSGLRMTNNMVQQLINIHTAYINTGHPDFILHNRRNSNPELYQENNRNREIVTFQSGDKIKREPTSRGIPNECVVVENLIISYFNIVRTAIEDCVPKTIMHFLINYIVENLHSDLMAKLFINGVANVDLMEESNEIIHERKRVLEQIRRHEQSLRILSDIDEYLKLSSNVDVC